MAKKSMIQREKNRKRLVLKYFNRRQKLKTHIAKLISLEEKFIFYRKLQNFPRNSIPVRLHNRCCITGRPKGYFRDFGLSRHLLRDMSHECLLPGITKSSF
uniref:Small ribosomal subunit protein uS14c n=1 Tax=Batophora oerstedii TaxID=3140 RepID=A0A386JM32_BATOE|nr:30S ribosomal protein S14 [Batophora oerstedii]